MSVRSTVSSTMALLHSIWVLNSSEFLIILHAFFFLKSAGKWWRKVIQAFETKCSFRAPNSISLLPENRVKSWKSWTGACNYEANKSNPLTTRLRLWLNRSSVQGKEIVFNLEWVGLRRLQSSFFCGRSPKSVRLHFKAIQVGVPSAPFLQW